MESSKEWLYGFCKLNSNDVIDKYEVCLTHNNKNVYVFLNINLAAKCQIYIRLIELSEFSAPLSYIF